MRYREPKYLIYSIPNGGKRNVREAARMKKQGVRAGVPDLQVLTSDKMFFVEMKAGKNKQSDNQIEFQKIVEQMNFKYYVCYSFDEFEKVCKMELG